MITDIGFDFASLRSAAIEAGAVGAYLIGSRTTHEYCTASTVSDMDCVIVAPQAASTRDCFDIAHRVRTELAASCRVHPGVRCRAMGELNQFARYLALQGYHTPFAVHVFGEGRDGRRLPVPALHRSSRSEYLCVLGETLWSELRSTTVAATPEDRAYWFAKTCLAYLNTVLVGLGHFLPTHSQRVSFWNEKFGEEPGLAHALNCKLGTERSMSLPMQDAMEAFREKAMCLARRIDEDGSHTDAAVFWLPPGWGALAVRATAIQVICAALYAAVLGGTLPGECASQFDDDLQLAFADGTATRVARLNEYRLHNSPESRRDWGSPQHWGTEGQTQRKWEGR